MAPPEPPPQYLKDADRHPGVDSHREGNYFWGDNDLGRAESGELTAIYLEAKMFGKRIRLFNLLGFEVRIDLSWIIIAVLVTWSLAKGLFPS